MNNKIDYRFKILYAVGIIMVVCGHCKGGGISFLIDDWFPFAGLHLAMFVFCSGYFYKENAEINIRQYIIKKIKSLIIPLYLYTVAYGIIVMILSARGFEFGASFNFSNVVIGPILNGHQFVYNMGGWFVFPLFMVEVYNVILRKTIGYIKNDFSEVAIFILHITIGIVGNALGCNGYTTGWWLVLVRILYFVPFYGLGIFYKKVLERYDKIPSFWYFSIVFVIRGAIMLIYGKNLAYKPAWFDNFGEGPLMPIIIGFLGIALWMRIATIMEPVIGRSKWINLIADNTYSIMMNQFLGFMLVKFVFAVISKLQLGFGDFSIEAFKTDRWYYYVPKDLEQMYILYAVAGIAVPILIQLLINKIKSKSNMIVS